MAQLIVEYSEKKGLGRYVLSKPLVAIGTEPTHDVVVPSKKSGHLFSVLKKGQAYELLPGEAKVQINHSTAKKVSPLKHCDRIAWDQGVAIFLSSDEAIQEVQDSDSAAKSLRTLQNIATLLQSPGGLQAGLYQALDALVEMAGAEGGYLLSEMGASRSGWNLLASRFEENPSHKALLSNTILKEAIEKKEPICVESIVGHPWAEAASVIEAKIFSAACFPLCVGDHVFGAAFLFSRTPGRSLKKDSLKELGLFVTQAALLLATQLELRKTLKENENLKKLVDRWPSELIFERDAGSPMLGLEKKIQKLAPTPLNMLLLGETGSGKELVAREIHRLSGRSHKPFVAINCAAIPPTLLESTLFGYAKGAFTGAHQSHEGKFVQAQGGTLFLDEIGDLSPDLQSKLLRVIQEQRVEPLGSSRSVNVDVRVVSATHQPLDQMIQEGSFRSDLYYRLNGSTLKLIPLRERKGDIPALCQHFLSKLGTKAFFNEGAMERLRDHDWPGNVRELEQVVTRAVFLSDGIEILAEEVELDGISVPRPLEIDPFEGYSLREAQDQFTQKFVERVLKENDGSRQAAARRLGVSERTLYRILSADKPVSPR